MSSGVGGAITTDSPSVRSAGAGWPMIISLHAEHTSTALVMVGTLASIGLAVALVALAGGLLPKRSVGGAEYGTGSLSEKHAQPIFSESGAVEQR